jgi:hypothetical protein
MGAGKLDITVRRGAAFSLALILQVSDAAPINLTGYTFSAKIRDKDPSYASSTTVLATMTVTAVDLSVGKINLSLTAAQTTLIPIGYKAGIWDILGTPSGGDPSPLVEGTVSIYSGAT